MVLHGHVRATTDIDLFAGDSADSLAGLLLANDFRFDPTRREFVRDEIPVHLVTIQQVMKPPRKLVAIEGVTTVSLEDLIAMKLRSGSASVLSAQDLADAIGLIRRHRLSSDFSRLLEMDLRPTYRKIVEELKHEADGGPESTEAG